MQLLVVNPLAIVALDDGRRVHVHLEVLWQPRVRPVVLYCNLGHVVVGDVEEEAVLEVVDVEHVEVAVLKVVVARVEAQDLAEPVVLVVDSDVDGAEGIHSYQRIRDPTEL